MRVLVATDAWHPQVNGVVRTLAMTAEVAKGLGAEFSFLTPESFRTFALPSYRDLRLALPYQAKISRLIAEARPDYIFILPWNFKDEIMGQLSFIRDWGGRFIVPIPEVKVFE